MTHVTVMREKYQNTFTLNLFFGTKVVSIEFDSVSKLIEELKKIEGQNE